MTSFLSSPLCESPTGIESKGLLNKPEKTNTAFENKSNQRVTRHWYLVLTGSYIDTAWVLTKKKKM